MQEPENSVKHLYQILFWDVFLKWRRTSVLVKIEKQVPVRISKLKRQESEKIKGILGRKNVLTNICRERKRFVYPVHFFLSLKDLL